MPTTPTTSSGETEQATDWQRPSRFLQKSNFYFANEKIFAPKEENSKGIENKEKLGDRLRVLGPHCYNKKNIRWLSYNDKKMQKKKRKKKTRQCCKTDKSCFFSTSSSPRRSVLLPCRGFPRFFKKVKIWFSLSSFFSPIRFGCKTIFYDSQIYNLKKKFFLQAQRESSSTPSSPFFYRGEGCVQENLLLGSLDKQ